MTEENKELEAAEDKGGENEVVVIEEPIAGKEPDNKGKEPDKGADELEKYSETVQRRFNKLTAKMREAERREQAAIDYATGLKTEYEALQKRSHTVDGSYVDEFENRVKAQESSLKNNLKIAITQGDVDAQAEINSQLAQLAVDKYRVAQAKLNREAETTQRKEQQQRQQERPPEQVQQRQQQPPAPDPRALKWADQNKWFGQDQPMTLTAFAIHKTLVEEEGYDPSTEDYYVTLDERMKSEWPHKFQAAGANGQKPAARSPVAPANGQGQVQTSKKEIRLTASQVAIAKKLGVSVENYAKHVAKLEKERR